MPPRKPTNPDRSNRSKDEINESFEDIKDSVKSSESLDPKAAEVAKRNAENVRKVAKALNAENTAKAVSALTLDISRTLSDITEKMFSKISELSDLQKAVKLEEEELKRLHGVDICASAITNMIASYEEKKAKATEELHQMQEFYKTTKAAFDKEQKEYQGEIKKVRDREAQEHEYNKAQQRKHDQDKFDEQLNAKAKASSEKHEAQSKEWNAREEAIKAREAEFASFQAQVAAFPEALKKEVARAEAIVGNTLKREYEHQQKLAEVTASSIANSLSQQVESLHKQISSLEATLASTRQELNAKSEQVVNIATQAVQSAAGSKAYGDMKEIASARESGGAAKK